MTPEQLDEAQREASEWRPRPSKISRRYTANSLKSIGLVSNFSGVEVPLKMERGTFVVPVELNSAVKLDFTVDSGASDVTVPSDVFSTLKRTGTIKQSDILPSQTYILADGSKSRSIRFKIRSLKVGDVVLNNVTASVSTSQGMLLLGQSFLSRFKSWSIDNAKHELHLER
ncbi:MAG: retropepsin-like aspartic protease [Pseudolabrys sp.]